METELIHLTPKPCIILPLKTFLKRAHILNMSFRESSVFQGHFTKGMSICLQTGILCIYMLIPIDLMCMMELYYSHTIWIKTVTFISLITTPFQLTFSSFKSCICNPLGYFPPIFKDQNIHKIRISSLSYSSFEYSKPAYSWFCYTWSQFSSKEE